MKISVDLLDRSYDISIGSGVFANALELFASMKSGGAKFICVADSSVLKAHPKKAESLSRIAEIVPVDGGEASKCFEKLAELCSLFAQKNADRKTFFIAWGGGVVGDLTGFAAAVYMRGARFYQIPTTLLAMVDSSVGGKTGINIPEGKNLVGAFHQPQGVFADTDFLSTLPEREFAAGMAEVVKCAVLGDEDLFDELEKLREPLSPAHPYLPEAIRRSCELKAQIVSEDELESAANGGRALLNLGHTFGHAIEKTSGYGKYLHGEAVAIGTVMACELSARLGFANCRARVEKLLEKFALPTRLAHSADVAAFMEAMSHDKKNSGGKLRFVLVRSIGDAFTQVVPASDAEKVVESFLK